jgi:hypothetical protein
MAMTHEELVAKRNAIKSKGNWDSTKPFDGPKYVVSAKAKKIEFNPKLTKNLKGVK